MTDNAPRHNPPPTNPEIDEAAVRHHAEAIARVARAYFTATLAADPHADHQVRERFMTAVRLATGKAVDQEWQRAQDFARHVGDDAIRRAFAAALGGAS